MPARDSVLHVSIREGNCAPPEPRDISEYG